MVAQAKEEAFRVYVTDALKIAAENTARYVGGNYMKDRYADAIRPKKRDERSCVEITADVVARCGLTVKKASPDGEACEGDHLRT